MEEAERLLERYKSDFSALRSEFPTLHTALDASPELQQELERLWLGSDFAAELTLIQTELFEDLLGQEHLHNTYHDWTEHLQDTLARLFPEPASSDIQTALKKQLRIFRKREMLRILWRDINGYADLWQTCYDLSALADTCIHYALQQLRGECIRLHGLPLDEQGEEQQLIVLAMGKYGAWELNLSSDIDLIFIFPENGETRVSPEFKQQYPQARVVTMQQYFNKLGQLLINVLDSTTADGQVFRVDMRLRPYGASGSLTLSVDAIEEYYQSQGRDWERFALIKARAVTGTAEAVASLMGTLHAFTYRRYIDFATIGSLRDLKRQIEQQVRRKGMHNNIKLGRGGIREIEFVVQVLQLIYGGHHKHLQQTSISKAMAGLVGENCLPAADEEKLRSCYLILRRTEHAIQALDDRQTHDYPQDDFSEYRIATVLGYDSAAILREELARVRDTVSDIFSAVIATPEDEQHSDLDVQFEQLWQGTLDEDTAEQWLQGLGFTRPQDLQDKLQGYRKSRQFLSMDAASRERMDRFMPQLLARLVNEEQPDLGFTRVFEFVQAVARRTVYLVLLLENQLALSQLIMLCTASPWVVSLLSRYPVFLDELLRPFQTPPVKTDLQNELRQLLLRTNLSATDEQLNTVQNFKQEQVLMVAAAELSGTLPLMKVSDSLSWVAEVVLEQVFGMAWQILKDKYGYPFNSSGLQGSRDFIIIGYGKLGGIELNYGSDLDLVFMHDGHAELETTGGETGARLNSGAFYVQLGQKILSLLNTHTMTGRLYEIDLRLRPSGASGALVSTPQAFSSYQLEKAWTWEHQALVRARVVCGSADLAQRFDKIRTDILLLPRDRARLGYDIVSMREKMRKQLGSKKPEDAFHLKQDRGGLVDIEFIVQYLVLLHASQCPDLCRWSDNMRLLDLAAQEELLPEADARSLQQAYIAYRSLLHKRALDNADYRLLPTVFQEQRDAVHSIWQQLFGDIAAGPLGEGSAIL